MSAARDEENKQIIRRFLASFAEGRWDDPVNPIDPEHVLQWLDDAVDWWIPGDTPFSGKMTKQRYLSSLAAMAAAADGPMVIEPRGWTVDGNRLAVEAESHLKLKNGGVYNNKYHFLFEIRNRKIVKFFEYCDLSLTTRAFGAAAAALDASK
jgi:ketosteroid isomerase-like protein